jgi:tRNA(fMet)-specific endonuclease VapC
MKYLLDSNIVIATALAAGESIRQKLADCDEGSVVTSAIVLAEVVYGSINGKPPPVRELEALVEEVQVLPFDDRAARAYGAIPFKRACYDHLIAAHAMSLGLILVTDNEKHFADVPGLKVENWTV